MVISAEREPVALGRGPTWAIFHGWIAVKVKVNGFEWAATGVKALKIECCHAAETSHLQRVALYTSTLTQVITRHQVSGQEKEPWENSSRD